MQTSINNPLFKIVPLSQKHNRKEFSCGNAEIDRYIQQYISQDSKRDLAYPFVMIENKTDKIAGFYTLSMTSIPLDLLPENLARKLPYTTIPAGLIGRLGVDKNFQRQNIGKALLMSACKKLLEAEIGMFIVIVDAIDGDAVSFYKKCGFQEFPESNGKNKIQLFCLASTLKALKRK